DDVVTAVTAHYVLDRSVSSVDYSRNDIPHPRTVGATHRFRPPLSCVLTHPRNTSRTLSGFLLAKLLELGALFLFALATFFCAALGPYLLNECRVHALISSKRVLKLMPKI